MRPAKGCDFFKNEFKKDNFLFHTENPEKLATTEVKYQMYMDVQPLFAHGV